VRDQQVRPAAHGALMGRFGLARRLAPSAPADHCLPGHPQAGGLPAALTATATA
jgi:hypothetical protein